MKAMTLILTLQEKKKIDLTEIKGVQEIQFTPTNQMMYMK